MPPRLSHRKSTTGCLRCKARKVKCDEQRPKCSPCTRHGVTCEYPALATRTYHPRQSQSRSSSALVHSSGLGTPQPSLPSPELGSLRVLELRLIHQWITGTANTMSSAQLPAVHEMWRVAVPQMAFEYEPLLHTLLALGAAHRATLLPNEAHSLRPIYHGYIDSALRYHRPMTANLDGNVSEAVCLNAVLFSLYTLFLRSETSEGPYEPPIMWISMARGIRTVMKNVYHQLVATESRLCPLLLAQPMLWNQGSTMQYTGPLKPFQHLLEHQIEEELSDKIRNAYAGAVQYLERLYIAVQTREPDFIIRKMFNGFPPVVPRLFLDLVSEKQPRALVILAHFFALAKSAENIWWLRGVPEREVCGINSIIPAEWKWALIWPLDVVSQPSTSKDPTEPSIPLSIRNVLDTLF